jgi:hypothetical protein
MRTLLILGLFTLAVSARSPSTGISVSHDSKEVPTVAYCDLIRNPAVYDKKEVRIKVVYRVGYEWEEVYCPDCFDLDGRTWVEFDEGIDSCTKRAVRRRISAWEGTLSIEVIGEFQSSSGPYGHMGAYRYKFIVKCMEKAKVLLKDARSPNLVPSVLFKDAC